MSRVELPLRRSGYVSRLYEIAYQYDSPLYDCIVRWGMLPLGGEAACRREFVRWSDPRPDHRVASLCCGTGSTERALLEAFPSLEITAVDLGRGQIERARRRETTGRVDYRVGHASRTGLDSESFDRVLVVMALHEMPRGLRLAILREARRICLPAGRVVVIEHGRPGRWSSRFWRAVWWLYWLPRNPEAATSRDLQRSGLDNEMREAGLAIVSHHVTTPDWIEAFSAAPSSGSSGNAADGAG